MADGEVTDGGDREATTKPKEAKVYVPKSAADEQRMKIEKLMKNPDKEVRIPDRKKEWKPKTAPEFVRHVMGSSAGAGSGEFHVYRGIRRREFARQAYIDGQGQQQREDEAFHQKLEENRAKAEEKTAKNRQKRLRKKQKLLAKKKQKTGKDEEEKEDSENDESDKVDSGDENDDAEENCFVIGGK
ncbi:PRKR-interacting protein 1 homolog [Glandiceps talaboti]